MEPECSIAMPYKDGVFIYSSDQGVYSIRDECALMLGLEQDKVIVENRLVGGGFGGREDAVVQPLAALAAYRTGRIVKVKFTRKESMLIHPKRHAFSIDLTLACDKEGHITAMREKILTDNGAYASVGGPDFTKSLYSRNLAHINLRILMWRELQFIRIILLQGLFGDSG